MFGMEANVMRERDLLFVFIGGILGLAALNVVQCNPQATVKARADPKFGGAHTEAGRDAITTDSKTSIILAGGLVAALGWTLKERRTRVHAEKGICRIAGVIE